MGLRVNNLLRSFRRHQPDVNALSAQLDGMLDAPASARLDAHVATCDACGAQLDGLRATRAALRSMPEATAPRSFRLRVADTVPVTAPRSPMLRWAPAAGAFASVVVAVVVGASLYSDGSSSSSQESAKSQHGSEAVASAPGPTAALDGAAGAALDMGSGAAADANGPSALDSREIAPSTGEVAPPEAAVPSLQPTSEAAGGADASLQYSTTNMFASDAARAVATAAVQIQAAAAAAPEDDGNKSTALIVIQIIGVAAALIAAAIAIRWWRHRGEEAL